MLRLFRLLQYLRKSTRLPARRTFRRRIPTIFSRENGGSWQKPDAAAEAETSSSKETGGQDNAARGEIPDAAGGQESGFSRKAGDAGSSISEKVGDAGSSIARKAGDASEKLVEQAGIAGSQMIEQAGGAVQEQTQKIVDDAKKSLKDRLKELISSMIDKL